MSDIKIHCKSSGPFFYHKKSILRYHPTPAFRYDTQFVQPFFLHFLPFYREDDRGKND